MKSSIFKNMKKYKKLMNLLRSPITKDKIPLMDELTVGDYANLIIKDLFKEKDDKIFSILMFILGNRKDPVICANLRQLFKENINNVNRLQSICDTIGMVDKGHYCDLLAIALKTYPNNSVITATIIYAIGMQKCIRLKRMLKKYFKSSDLQIRRCARESFKKLKN